MSEENGGGGDDDEQEGRDKKLDQLAALTGSVIVQPEIVIGDDEAAHVREEIKAVSQRVEDGYLNWGRSSSARAST